MRLVALNEERAVYLPEGEDREASGRVRFLNIGGSTPDVSICLIPGITYLL